MGSGFSRKGSSSYSRAGPRQPNMRRSISSILICGASSSSSAQMEDYPAELLANSAENGRRKKLKFPKRNSDSVEHADDLISIKSGSVVSPRRFSGAYENPTLEVGAGHDEPSDSGKWLFESKELDLVPFTQCIDSSRCNGTASSSYGHQPSCFLVSENESSGTNGLHFNMIVNTSQNGQGFNNSSSVHRNALSEPLLHEVSVENNVFEEVDCSSSDFGSSFVSDPPLDFHDISLEETLPDLGYLVSEGAQDRQDESLLRGNMVSISNTLPTNSDETRSCRARRNSRRLFWDALSRRSSRSSRRQADSRTIVFSPVFRNRFSSPDRQLLDFSSAFIDERFEGDSSSRGNLGTNAQQLNSRPEIWGRQGGGTVDSTYNPPPACPRGVHVDGSCSCQSISSTEESSPNTGVSQIVMVAEALFGVLDRIHQQPMPLSLSVISLPAPESVVDSFPVKIHGKSEKSKSTDDESQCYICLAEYEEGDEIRVLPCHHEYHLSCVDKWLKEIHGVCPLCRGDVHLGSTEI